MLKYKLFEANPEKSYNFPFILVYPTQPNDEIKIFVEGNNSVIYEDEGQQSFDAQKKYAIDFAKDLCFYEDGSRFTRGYLQQQLNQPLIIPIIERCDNEHKEEYYTQMLGRNVVLDKNSKFAFLSKQVVAMVKDVQQQYRKKGLQVENKAGLIGFSTSGVFAGRMQFAEPETFDLCLSVCSNAVQPLPLDSINGIDLPYPLGTKDYKEIFGKPFNMQEYKKAQQMFIVGINEPNEKYNIAKKDRLHDSATQENFIKVYGDVTIQIRQQKIASIMEELGMTNITCSVLDGGHSFDGKGREISEFLINAQNHLNNSETITQSLCDSLQKDI